MFKLCSFYYLYDYFFVCLYACLFSVLADANSPFIYKSMTSGIINDGIFLSMQVDDGENVLILGFLVLGFMQFLTIVSNSLCLSLHLSLGDCLGSHNIFSLFSLGRGGNYLCVSNFLSHTLIVRSNMLIEKSLS